MNETERLSPASKSTANDIGAAWSILMSAAQDGDKAAYQALLTAILPNIRRAVSGKVFGSVESVDDIVQDILLSLHAVRHTYDPARPFRPWLNAIIRYRLADGARRHYRRVRHETLVEILPETSAGGGTNTEQDWADEAASLRHAIAALPAGQRRAIELIKVQEMSLIEAAAASGMSVGALKVAAHRAYKALKKSFDRERL